MINANGIKFIKIKRTIKHVRGDINSWVRVTYEIHKHWSPTNDDSTVCVKANKSINSSIMPFIL